MSISDKIREAREWSHCIDTLKSSVDSMYEICRIQQNFLGCEEAIMFLKNGIRDFLSLIDTIKIEQNWENSEKRPMAPVAWEIRGTISRNNLAPQIKNVKEVGQTKFEDTLRTKQNDKKAEENGGWQLVERKRGSGRNSKNPQTETEIPFSAIGKLRKAPKSAMDLPQTKASMAKMAYSRQLLFEKHKKTLLEKFNAKRRTEKVISDRKGTAGDQQTKTKPPTTPLNRIILAGEEGEDKSVEEEKEGHIAGCLKTLIDQLSDDCEWRAMTEEEQSLAQEEESLKKEIEEEEEDNLPHFVDEFKDKNNLELKDKKEEENNGQQQRHNGREMPINANGVEGGNHYRNPGELAQLRAKLLSPTKRRRVEDIDYSSENKLRRAEELRTMLKQERAQRLHLLHRRVEEVRTKREAIQQKKMAHLEMVRERIQKAEENRQKSLEEIVQKAQEDEMKIIEMNLLNNFEAANQRLGKRFTQIRERNRHAKVVRKAEEERLKRIEENRQQRGEAERRRRDAEEQRTKRLKDKADQGLERQFYALKHRVKTMEEYRAKVAQHSQKVCQRKQSELADKQKLLDKIQKKHEKRTVNYEQCKEQVRRRAVEMSSPRPTHFWAQTLAEFSQIPSDLALHQKPFISERAAETGETEVDEAAMATAKGCFRCETTKESICTDLQLVSHILSEEHLAKAADKKLDSILQSSVISYEFVKSELEKMSFLPPPPNSEELAEVMCKSSDESCSLGSGPSSMDKKTIAKNARFISDHFLMKLLMADEISGTNSGNGAKKKRIKIRQKFIREFESMAQKNDDQGQMEHKTVQQQNAKLLNKLQAKLDKLEKSVEKGHLEEEEMVGLYRKVTELLNTLRSAQNAKEGEKLQQMILETKLLEKLLALNNLVGQRKPKFMSTELGMRMFTKSLNLFGYLVEFEGTKTDLQTFGAKTALYLCDVFKQCAAKSFHVSPSVLGTTAGGHDSEVHSPFANACSSSFSLSVALFIVQQFGRLFTRSIDTESANSLFAFLCSSCSLLEFISLCAKQIEPNELIQKAIPSLDLELFNEGRPSVCEVITCFITSLLLPNNNSGKKAAKSEEGQKPINDEAMGEAVINDKAIGEAVINDKAIGEAVINDKAIGEAVINDEAMDELLLGLGMSAGQSKNIAQNEATDASRSCCSSSSRTTITNHHQCSANQLCLCAVHWMYCLSIIAYNHFRHQLGAGGGNSLDISVSFNPILSSTSNPPSPSKNERFSSDEMTATLSICFLRQFNAIAQFSSRQQLTMEQQTMLQFFLSVENGQTMALRMACIFRSILQFVFKSSSARQNRNVFHHHQMTDLLEQCVRAVGHFASGDNRNQLLCVFGWQRSLLSMLCTSLPLSFVHSEPQKHLLIPTLITILRHSPIGVQLIRTHFCLQYLIGYLKSAIQSTTFSNNFERAKFDFWTLLEPSIDKWVAAKEFFESITANDFN